MCGWKIQYDKAIQKKKKTIKSARKKEGVYGGTCLWDIKTYWAIEIERVCV